MRYVEIIDRDYVIVFGQRIERPKEASPSEWLEFWEDVGDPQPADS